MTIFKNEFRRIWRRPLFLVVLAGALILGAILQLFTGDCSLLDPRFEEIVYGGKRFRQQFAGPIGEQWILDRQAEEEDILKNPEYKVGPEEQEKVLEKYKNRSGYAKYSREEMLKFDVLFLNPKGRMLYNQYEDISFASHLKQKARKEADKLTELYRKENPGPKGEKLAQKTQLMYDTYIADFQPNYGWHMGFDSIRDILIFFPHLVGSCVLIALTPLFSEEYSRRTAGLLLTSRHGRKDLARAKIGVGLLTAVCIWGMFSLLYIGLAFLVYGPEGAAAFWQGSRFQILPYPLNQLETLTLGLSTSLLGTVFFGGFMMLVSSLCRNRLASLLIGAAFLLIPAIEYPLTDIPLLANVFRYTPTAMMRGTYLWEEFGLVSIFGMPVLRQWGILGVLSASFVISVFLTVQSYCRHQVKT